MGFHMLSHYGPQNKTGWRRFTKYPHKLYKYVVEQQ